MISLSGMFNLRNLCKSVTHKHHVGVNTHDAKEANTLSGRLVIQDSLFVMLYYV